MCTISHSYKYSELLPPGYIDNPKSVSECCEGDEVPMLDFSGEYNFQFMGQSVIYPDPGDGTIEDVQQAKY